MERRRRNERGEGKIGCIVSLLVMVVGVAAAVKIVPEYLANDAIMTNAKEKASQAGVSSQEELLKQLRAKIQNEGISEALKPGAITFRRNGNAMEGNCTIRVAYTRTVDFYGITSMKLTFDQSVTMPYFNAR